MGVIIFFKGERYPIKFDFAVGEFKRFSQDYQNYLKEGLPAQGTYECRTAANEPSATTYRPTLIKFAEISAIG